MKHGPGQGSLHRGKSHPGEEQPTKTPAGFREMLSAKPMLKSSSSDTTHEEMVSILSREDMKLMLGSHFQKENVESASHLWGLHLLLRLFPHCQGRPR